VLAEREAALDAARRAAQAAPGDVDALIWLGRRTAYLGRYGEAIEIYGRGGARPRGAPRLLRHRGHRYLTVRRLDAAIGDLLLAAGAIEGRPDEVEPDGLPNARGIPTSTLHTNVWYHLGLARYLKGELAEAERCFRRCLALSTNDDMRSAASHWLWMTLCRRGDAAAAAEVVKPIHAGMEILENHAYHRLLLLYRGERSPEELLAWAEGEGEGVFATAGYGVANWHWVAGRRGPAVELLWRVVARGEWPAFGHLAAEFDLARIGDRAL
jgi:tetratricopeptide (TPR) repeat protein